MTIWLLFSSLTQRQKLYELFLDWFLIFFQESKDFSAQELAIKQERGFDSQPCLTQ